MLIARDTAVKSQQPEDSAQPRDGPPPAVSLAKAPEGYDAIYRVVLAYTVKKSQKIQTIFFRLRGLSRQFRLKIS